MGNGAVRKQHKYLEPYHVDVTPKNSARHARGSFASMQEGGSSSTPTADAAVVRTPRTRKVKRSSTGTSTEEVGRRHANRAIVKQQLGQTDLIRESLGLAPKVMDQPGPRRPQLMEAASRCRPVDRANSDIERLFPSLIDADDAATTNIQKVHAELVGTMRKDIAKRRSIFRALCLQWHASRNDGTPSGPWAERVYNHVMSQRDWYLAANEEMTPNLATDAEAALESLKRYNSLSSTYGKNAK